MCGVYFPGTVDTIKETAGGITMENRGGFGSAKLPSDELKTNLEYIRNLFTGDETIQFRHLTSPYQTDWRFCLVYADGMVNNRIVNADVIRPLLEYRFPERPGDPAEFISQHVMFSDGSEKTAEVEKIVQGLVYGDSVLLIDGCAEALVLNTKGWAMRSIEEPESERSLRGPREGFNESILTNLSMLRRKLRTPDLKFHYRTFGRRSRTKICVCYLDSLINHDVLTELEKRLDDIDIDATLDSNYITEIIRDKTYSPVKTIGSTERPDVVASKLLEGRIALFVDGSPTVLTMPHLFIEHFQADEDYYINYVFASIGRMLRILSFFVSISMPAIYVALVTFHQEMLPTPSLLSIITARQGVPFPTALETLFMIIVFEMLRESGARMPGLMGQALSIVGALVIGQAAVDAKIVSAPIIIIVAFTGIAGLMVPKIKGFVIMMRFLLLGFSCVLGIYGYLLGVIAMLTALFGTSSFGVPIMPDVYADDAQDYKDIYWRTSWKKMLRRPKLLSWNHNRQATKGKAK